jgi:hypothetical protein
VADNTTLDPGAGGDVVATDDITGVHYQKVKLVDGTAEATTAIAAGGGVEAGALRVTVASDSTGVLSVDDNGATLSVDDGGGSLTIDGSVSAAVTNAGTFAVQDSEKVADNAAFTDGTTKVQPAGYIFDEAAGTALTENDAAAARIDSKRAQVSVIEDETTRGRRTTVTAGNALKVDNSAVTQPVSNAGTFVTQENGSALTALQLIDDTVFADDAAFTVGTSKVNAIGLMADQTATDSVNEGDIGIPRMTLDRKQITTVAPSSDTEGLDVFRTLDADETEEDVKTSAGKLYGWFIYNDGAAEVYVKFYNATAANTTVGTTTPRLTIPIPAGGAANVEFTNGIGFDTAICIAATTGVADADTAAPAANQVVANVFYK